MNELLRLLRIWHERVEGLSVDLATDNRRLEIEAHLSAIDIYASMSIADRERIPVATVLSANDAELSKWLRWLSTGDL